MSQNMVSISRRFLSTVLIAICTLALGLAFPCNDAIAQGNPFNSSQPDYPNWRPFEKFKWNEDQPVVMVNRQWYGLVSIDGVTVEQLFEKCKAENWNAKKRIEEDLVQLLRLMDHNIDDGVPVELLAKSGKVIKLEDYVKKDLKRKVVSRNPFSSDTSDYPKWSPFQGVRWKEGRPCVLVEKQWYELVSIHGVTVEAIKKKCSDENWNYQKRFTEDLVQILRLMEVEIDKLANLKLKDSKGTIIELRDVVMTPENLRAIARNVEARSFSVAEMQVDLESFQKSLNEQFAYLNANGVDLNAAIARVQDKLNSQFSSGDEVGEDWLAGELQKIIALYIDGHAGVSGRRSAFESGHLPFMIDYADGQFAALKPDRSAFLDSEFPFIESIDGIELSKWLKETEVYIAKGSPQYRRKYALRTLAYIQQIRKKMGQELAGVLKVGLKNKVGETKSIEMPIGDRRIESRNWPRLLEPQVLSSNIGYLPIKSMDDQAVELIKNWLPKFKQTDGLIVDVRGNGGGTRLALIELAGYLMTAEDTPRIGNVAKYRLFEEFKQDHLSGRRYVYRKTNPKFDKRDRKVIQDFMKTFQPEWTPAQGQFSEWHFMVFSKQDDDSRFDYEQPVVILMDEGCFSATDIFLGAFKNWPNVTLMGQPSGGGSARTQTFRLPNSGISVRCASMASFQPSGKLYDRNGIQPDVLVSRPPEYFLAQGEDVILKQAISFLKERKRE